MNLTKVRIASDLATLDLPLVGIKLTDEYIAEQIDGLGPPEVGLHLRDTYNAGLKHHGRRPQGREIVVRMALNPDYASNKTAGDLRDYIYGLFSAGDEGDTDIITVTLFEGSTAWGSTQGYLRRCEIVPFAKDPQVQIVISCTQSFIKGTAVPINLSTLNKSTPTIVNPGKAPAGFYMRIKFTSNRNGWWLKPNNRTKWIELTTAFLTNDELIIDTRPGRLTVQLKRGSTTTNLYSALTSTSIWPQLKSGTNGFTTAGNNFTWLEFSFNQQHWGI